MTDALGTSQLDDAAASSGAADHDDGFGTLQIGALAARYRSRDVDPVDVADIVHARARARENDHAWIHLRGKAELRADAELLLSRWPDRDRRPPLFGIPVAVKDNIDVAGLPTTAACDEFRYVPSRSATLVERLLAAGALIVGKTNLDQFATGLTGTRSPFGICTSPFDRSYISGGSSSGSAIAVATGIVSVAIGTDTAGSGRVPAAFTNTVGLKPSRGLVSTAGVVPACRSLDCPSVFSLSVADAWSVLRVVAHHDETDPWSRAYPPLGAHYAADVSGCIGVPRSGQLDFHRDPDTARAFSLAVQRLVDLGFELVEVDIAPLLRAGELLYQGPLVAERLADLRDLLHAKPDAFFPVTREVLAAADVYTAADSYRAIHTVTEIAASVLPLWGDLRALMLPTTPTTPTVSETAADPHGVNTILGRYTTFCNVLDLAAISAPNGLTARGLPTGVTFYGPAGSDAVLAGVADAFHASVGANWTVGATRHQLLPAVPVEQLNDPTDAEIVLAVVGAHRLGQPLHSQLTELGAELLETAWTAAAYRLVALRGSPARPGLVRVPDDGHRIEVELYRVRTGQIGSLLARIPAPLGLGTVELDDSRNTIGFLCEEYAARTAIDITSHGSWPAYLAAVASMADIE